MSCAASLAYFLTDRVEFGLELRDANELDSLVAGELINACGQRVHAVIRRASVVCRLRVQRNL
jgi:hypothetical protein